MLTIWDDDVNMNGDWTISCPRYVCSRLRTTVVWKAKPTTPDETKNAVASVSSYSHNSEGSLLKKPAVRRRTISATVQQRVPELLSRVPELLSRVPELLPPSQRTDQGRHFNRMLNFIEPIQRATKCLIRETDETRKYWQRLTNVLINWNLKDKIQSDWRWNHWAWDEYDVKSVELQWNSSTITSFPKKDARFFILNIWRSRPMIMTLLADCFIFFQGQNL